MRFFAEWIFFAFRAHAARFLAFWLVPAMGGGIVMTVVYGAAVIIRARRRYGGLGLDSILNVVIYVIGIIGLMRIAS